MLHDFTVLAGIPLEDGRIHVMPYSEFIQNHAFRGSKFLLANLDEDSRMLLIAIFESQLRKFNSSPNNSDSRFIVSRDLFCRLNPAFCEIGYVMVPGGEIDITPKIIDKEAFYA